MLISDLQRKDIVNTNDGTKLGRIVDLDVNNEGIINHLVVEPYKLMKRIGVRGEVTITFKEIITIGHDVILVDLK